MEFSPTSSAGFVGRLFQNPNNHRKGKTSCPRKFRFIQHHHIVHIPEREPSRILPRKLQFLALVVIDRRRDTTPRLIPGINNMNAEQEYESRRRTLGSPLPDVPPSDTPNKLLEIAEAMEEGAIKFILEHRKHGTVKAKTIQVNEFEVFPSQNHWGFEHDGEGEVKEWKVILVCTCHAQHEYVGKDTPDLLQSW